MFVDLPLLIGVVRNIFTSSLRSPLSTLSVSGLEKELRELEHEKANFQIENEEAIKEYYDLRQQLDNYSKDMQEVITHPSYCLAFLQPGRLIRVKYGEHDFGWGVVVNFTQRRPARGHSLDSMKPHQQYLVETLLVLASDSSVGGRQDQDLPPGISPPKGNDKGKLDIVPVLLSCIQQIGHLRVFLPKNLQSSEQRLTVRKALDEVKRRFPDGIAVLDPIENMGIVDDSFKKLLRVSTMSFDA